MQRRERPAGEWSDVATAMESEVTVNGQTRSKEFEFRVIAMHKAGEGEGQQQSHGSWRCWQYDLALMVINSYRVV